MRAELRRTERIALRLIAEAHAAQEPPPSIREMAAAARVASTNAIAEAVERLIRRGLVTRGPERCSRTLRLAVDFEAARERWGGHIGPPPAPVRLRGGDFYAVAFCFRCDLFHTFGSCKEESYETGNSGR